MLIIIHVSTSIEGHTYVVPVDKEFNVLETLELDPEQSIFIEPHICADVSSARMYMRNQLGWDQEIIDQVTILDTNSEDE